MSTEAGMRLAAAIHSHHNHGRELPVEECVMANESIAAIEAEAANDVVAEWEKVADRAYERGRKEALTEAAEKVRALPWTNTKPPWGDDITLGAVLAILEDR